MDTQLKTQQGDLFGSNGRAFESGRTPFDGLRAWSAITHGIGGVLALIGTIFLLFKTLPNASASSCAGVLVFGISLVVLYTGSTLYHSVRCREYGRILLRKVDHTAVYCLIAGTYTPVCLAWLPGTFGIVLLASIWTLALVGSILSFRWINMPRKLTAGIYIALGWISVAALPFIYAHAGMRPIIWLLCGGILYTLGGIMYALKWPGRDNPNFGCHEIFHVFIVLGSIVHYAMIYACIA